MTPAEKLGYKVGDEFKVVKGGFKEIGVTVELAEDDGSNNPYFSPVKEEDKNNCKLWCLSLNWVQPLRITLSLGDYIATADLSEDDYHNVAKAFMAAGAVDRGDAQWEKNEYDKDLRKLGWDCRNNELWSSASAVAGFTRQLTLSQILNATNAGGHANQQATETKPMHLADQLEAAIRAQSEANAEVERLQAEWRDAYPGISGCVDIDVEDIKPEDWKAGDIVRLNEKSCRSWFTPGKTYTLSADGIDLDGDVMIEVVDDGDTNLYLESDKCSFICRP